jgi:hypothetical protein
MADESTLRQRKPQPKNETDSEVSQPSTPTKKHKKRSSDKVDREDPWDGYSPYVDVLRVISFIVVASMGLSYVISGGESFWWGHKNKPEWMTQKFYKELILGPVSCTSSYCHCYTPANCLSSHSHHLHT